MKKCAVLIGLMFFLLSSVPAHALIVRYCNVTCRNLNVKWDNVKVVFVSGRELNSIWNTSNYSDMDNYAIIFAPETRCLVKVEGLGPVSNFEVTEISVPRNSKIYGRDEKGENVEINTP